MSRTAHLSGELVAVSIDGKGAAWCDGVYSGDPEIVAYAKLAAELGVRVPIGQQVFTAHAHDALGALASLCACSPGRAFVKEAPARVLEVIEVAAEPDPRTVWGDGDV